MASKSKINIVSRLSSEFSSDIKTDNVTYHVQTEDMGPKTCKVISRVFLKGEVVLSRKTDYAHLVKLDKFAQKLSSLMENHHKTTIDLFLKDKSRQKKSKSEYFEDVKQLLRKGGAKEALRTLREALENFPADPFLLSYYGCLVAVAENNPKEGIKICREALASFKSSTSFGSEFFYPVFYLNLGRASLKGDNKAEAVKAFQEGLVHDPENHDLLWELTKLGRRKQPPVPFLERGNPINKYIGMLISKVSK
ncbi:MAG: tetratricopeptide repeat protein [Acidobacteriota bacterium]